jgi:hypothetical protein
MLSIDGSVNFLKFIEREVIKKFKEKVKDKIY